MNKLTKAVVTGSVLGLAYMASDKSSKRKMKSNGNKIMKKASSLMDMF